MSGPPPGRATPRDAALAALFPLAVAAAAAFGGEPAPAPPTPRLLLLGAAVPALLALSLLVRRAREDGVPLAEAAGWPASHGAAGRDLARGALCGALAAFAAVPFTMWFFSLLARFGVEPAAQRISLAVLAADTPVRLAAAAAAVVLVAPLGEELLYRSLLQRGLRDRLPAAAAVPLAAAFFAAMHLDFVHAPGLFLAGLLFGLLYDRGSLALCFGAHAAFNALNLAFLLRT